VLRGFDDVQLAAGESKRITMTLTRRDISNWDTARQDWVINSHEKVVFVGYSSTAIALNHSLPALVSA
jgi:beta-glucosidase